MVEEYPRNLMELEANFASEEACRVYLAQLRWPAGFRCPRCGSEKAWVVRGLWECAGCGCQTSVTAGTIFQDTRTPLPVWFRAMWWVTTQKNGASALGLQRVLGLKQYRTAWTILHRLRRAMVRPGRDLLTGRVEVDECYVGAWKMACQADSIWTKRWLSLWRLTYGQANMMSSCWEMVLKLNVHSGKIIDWILLGE